MEFNLKGSKTTETLLDHLLKPFFLSVHCLYVTLSFRKYNGAWCVAAKELKSLAPSTGVHIPFPPRVYACVLENYD